MKTCIYCKNEFDCKYNFYFRCKSCYNVQAKIIEKKIMKNFFKSIK